MTKYQGTEEVYGELFVSAFGQRATPAQVLADAEREGVTPQDYVRDALAEVERQGGSFPDDSFEVTCEALDIMVCLPEYPVSDDLPDPTDGVWVDD